MTFVLFLIILGVLVFVHELGHFIVAKRSGMRVDEFGLGFPPKLLSRKYGETEYSLNLIPFGGFVKIFGEDSIAEGKVTEGAFTSKKRPLQAAVLVAGIAGNLLFAWFLISIGFMFGLPSPMDARFEGQIQNPRLSVVSVLPNSPASEAGLRSGDVILSIASGGKDFAELLDVDSARAFIGGSEVGMTMSIRHGTEEKNVTLTPKEGIIPDRKAIGIGLDVIGTLKLSPIPAVIEGARTAYNLSVATVEGLFGFLRDAVFGKADLSQVTGPVGLAGYVGDARSLGFVYLLSFTAFISINLAIINLLPIPALDGGRLLFVAIEAIRRKAISAKFTERVNTVGFFGLIALMLLVTYHDVMKLF